VADDSLDISFLAGGPVLVHNICIKATTLNGGGGANLRGPLFNIYLICAVSTSKKVVMHHHHRDHLGIEDPRALTIPPQRSSIVRLRRELKNK